MINSEFVFCFKGARNYVHGTDIFNKAVELISKNNQPKSLQNIDMSIRGISSHNLTVIDMFSEEAELFSKSVKVSFKAFLNEKQIKLSLVENESNIDCRYEYNEDEIIDAADYDKNRKEIRLVAFEKYTLIEKIVALNKGLLNNLYPDIDGKWYFTRIKFNEFDLMAKNDLSIKIVFKKSLQLKLTDSFIYLDNNFVGNIYFSLV